MSSSAPTRYPPTFDPRQVPVLQGAAADGLAAAPAGRLTPEGLRERFARPPVWTPELVRERKFMDRSPAQAAVLLGLVMRDEPTVLLTQRPAHMSTHSAPSTMRSLLAAAHGAATARS